jgi:hypothetical protein
MLVLPLSAHSQVTVFNNSLSRISLSFVQEYQTKNFFVRVPNGTVTEARMRIQGFDLLGQALNPADVVLVTDVSGSMDDDCSSSNPPLTETDCKIRDAQRADISFLDNVNLNYIHVGLVDYSTCPTSDNIFSLSNNYGLLTSEINSYNTQSRTNMGGGMELAMHELLQGSNARAGIPKYMIIMTDGIANNYYGGGGYYSRGTCRQDSGSNINAKNYVTTIANQAASQGIIIYGIAFGADADRALVRSITTNGQSYYAPDAATLTAIYNDIARSISVMNSTMPVIRSTNPLSLPGWQYASNYSGDVIWNGASCGTTSTYVSCSNFITLIQDNLAQCTSNPCDIRFSVYSTTVGMLNLSDLYIEINEPPVGNYPPVGSCLFIPMLCNQDVAYVDIDDPLLVTDANDALNTLIWRYDSSRLMESSGGSHFTYNNNFNTARQLAFLVDSAYLQNPFWRTFFFNISDPWGASTSSCINVSYAGCAASVCGNGPPPGPGEQCELNNTINNIYCQQPTVNCSNAPLARTRDPYGNCNNICLCVYDIWSDPPLCIAGSCGAVCSNGQTQQCPAPGGYPGIQSCNTTTCQWNTCTPTGTCGDNIINQASEQCEPNNNDNNPNCQQENESCIGVQLITRPDLLGNCNNDCQCYNDTWSAAACVAGKCGAVCSDEQTQPCTIPGGYPGIQSCNTTTCQWNTCTLTGKCGDGIINQPTEQCELNSTLNNTYCSQDTENCTDAPRARTRDLYGNCNANCGCAEDLWSEPSCVAGACGAICSSGATQPCTTPNGYPGIQTCDETTCDWSTCITTLSCGDDILTNPPETCELPNTYNNTNCSQSTEQCTGPKISFRDDFGDCDDACACVYDAFGEAFECSVDKCSAECDAATPPQPCTTGAGHSGSKTCDLETCTFGSCRSNPLTCGPSVPSYLLHTGQPLDISLSDVFVGDTGGITSISHSHGPAISVNDNLPTSISITSNAATFDTMNIRVTTDEGVESESCSVNLLNLDANCDRPECEAYAESEDFEGLNSSGCLDSEIWVTDPYAAVRVSDYITSYLLHGFSLLHLGYTADFTAFDGFGVNPPLGTQATTFYITNITDVPHGTVNGSVIKVKFDDYINPSQDYVRICPELRRLHYYIGELSYEPNSTLLITGSRAVTGYYERDGFVFSKGPYIFIAKVWMRK